MMRIETIWTPDQPWLDSQEAAELLDRTVEWIRFRRGLPPAPLAGFRALHAAGRQNRRADWEAIRNWLVDVNKGLVFGMIHRVAQRSDLDVDEWISDGMLKLDNCVRRFDPWRGLQFSTYFCNAIWRPFLRNRRRESEYRLRFCSLESVGSRIALSALRADAAAAYYAERAVTLIDGPSALLTADERTVLRSRYLSEDGRRRRYRELGPELGCSASRIQQITASGLRKLREALRGV